MSGRRSDQNLSRGETAVHWVEGTLVVSVGPDVLLVDPQASPAALEPWLPRVRAIALTSGRTPLVCGLLPLLSALEPHRDTEATLTLHLPSTDERAASIAELWVRHWADRYPLTVDSERPGTPFEAGPVRIITRPLLTGERTRAGVQELDGIGMILQTDDLSTALLRGTAPLPSLERWLKTEPLDLAVLEVAALPWPVTLRPLRLRTDEAATLASCANELWLIGDDGRGL